MQARKVVLAAAASILLGAGAAQADVFNMGPGLTSVDMVTVGNPGNAGDPANYNPQTGLYTLGSVAYRYSIDKYDVTSAQYCDFLNSVAATDTYGLYQLVMSGTTYGDPGLTRSGSPGSYTYSVASGRANLPVTDVSFWDCCRFANWLDNGQPTGPEGPGTTETGAYTLTATGIANNTINRNPGATWAVTSENEWYKAAYYDPCLNGGTGGYWEYPTQSNTITTSMANYDSSDTTPVGSYPYPSYYGTYDQGGNVAQWTDTSAGPYINIWGGSFFFSSDDCQSSAWGYGDPGGGYFDTGFRVTEIPEPTTMAVLALGGLGLLNHNRKHRRANR